MASKFPGKIVQKQLDKVYYFILLYYYTITNKVRGLNYGII